ncbi:TetR/AcrR family transcriptional regulator [Piscinibacter sp.]|uniref:TetR/AcrR family transcriptional regulator n=1 Tax=Piscinibacter sp. TaxID=1903157 RepID=UPI002CCCD7DF|nr:helix-turn-helix domain-containing protein [Albitalea sp.]HUG21769.1 helix-turn-helix domain-containing protein [Albitalea sp.]
MALRLFWRHGYEGTSIAALAEAVGVPVPSLYAAFGNKESLFLRAVEHYGRYAGRLYDEAFRARSAKAAARAVLMGEVELVCGRGTPEGCLMVQGALATSPESEVVREKMARLRRQAEVEIAHCFARFCSVGGLPAGWDPKTLAAYVTTVAAGLAVQAKSGMPRAQLTRVAEMAMLIWPEGSQ